MIYLIVLSVYATDTDDGQIQDHDRTSASPRQKLSVVVIIEIYVKVLCSVHVL